MVSINAYVTFDFEVKLIRACFRFYKSNLPYFNTLGRDLTVFEEDQFIYFIRLVAMDRTCISPFFWILDISMTYVL